MGDTTLLVPDIVPESVKEALRKDWISNSEKLKSDNHNGDGVDMKRISNGDEEVLFCEPPTWQDGLQSLYFISIISGLSIGNVVGSFLVIAFFTPLVACAFISLALEVVVVFYALYGSRLRFYAYKVITNHRIALVIPNNHLWIGKPVVKSVYLRQSMNDLAKHNEEGLEGAGFVPDHFISMFHEPISTRGAVCVFPFQPYDPSEESTDSSLYFRVETQEFESVLKEALRQALTPEVTAHPFYKFCIPERVVITTSALVLKITLAICLLFCCATLTVSIYIGHFQLITFGTALILASFPFIHICMVLQKLRECKWQNFIAFTNPSKVGRSEQILSIATGF